uniref:TseI n=1 Tax=Thermus sp. 93170 TaxID=1046939 RepID=G3JXD0_9DEIN|nr:TseI [Thermus sp. 93170]
MKRLAGLISLADLIQGDTEFKISWENRGKKALTLLAEKAGIRCDEQLDDLLSQALDLARSTLTSGKNPDADIAHFWEEVEKNATLLTKNDYLRAAVVALSFAHRFARTDYGSSRQRGFGQLWGDAIQGFLGEIAFQKFMRSATSGRTIPILDASEEDLGVALSADIVEVITEGKSIKPSKRISIKTTKLHGRWLDVPYAQNKHSDIYVLVKVGTDADALFNFLASVGALEKVLTAYQEGGLAEGELPFLNEGEALKRAKEEVEKMKEKNMLFLAFIAGWKEKDRLSQTFEAHEHNAQRARTKITVYSGVGTISSGSVRTKQITFRGPLPKNNLLVEFYPIGKFSKSQHALCSTDLLVKDLNKIAELLSAPEEGDECAQ